MISKRIVVVLIASLPLMACGSSSDETADTGVAMDAAKPTDTAPADKPVSTSDTYPSQLPDTAPADKPASSGEAGQAADTAPDVQASKPDTATDLAKDGAVADAPVGDASTSDASPDTASDGRGDAEPDGLLQASQVFGCKTDSDCCTVVDGCRAIAYLYSKASGAPLPTISPSTGVCLACIAPPIQLRCVEGICTGEKTTQYDSRLTQAHCGYVALPTDGGLSSLVLTTATAPAKTSWSCGSN